MKHKRHAAFGRWCSLAMLVLLMGWIALGGTAPAWAGLAQGDAITDPAALLRYALPIDNGDVRQLQGQLEEIERNIRRKRWSSAVGNVKKAQRIVDFGKDALLASVRDESKTQGETLVEQIKTQLGDLAQVVENQNKSEVLAQRESTLATVGRLEELMVQGFPFEVPQEYAKLPQLKGRATIAMETTKGPLTVVVDGYSAPVNAGNFVDLVQRGFYNDMPFDRAEDYYVLQAGDPPGPEEGFMDPKTKQYRAIPLEVLIRGEAQPIYGETLEDLGIYLADLALPFNAYGALALARPADDPNGGSSQFFFFKFDREVTPPGYNLMDGRYSVFGYAVGGDAVLRELTQEDRIISAKVVAGSENLVQPS